jgi:hypothetical protein
MDESVSGRQIDRKAIDDVFGLTSMKKGRKRPRS